MSDRATSRLRGIYQAHVTANDRICPEHYRLRLVLSQFPPSAPGQFVNIRCARAGAPAPAELPWPRAGLPRPGQPELLRREPLLRRPFSLAGRRDRADGAIELEIVHRVVGPGTDFLAALETGAVVEVLGPLGRGFSVLPARPRAALVGGGVGIAPLLYLAGALRDADKRIVAFAGARSARLLPLRLNTEEPPARQPRPNMCAQEFAARGAAAVIATDDGSAGVAGLVHEAFQQWLQRTEQPAEALAVYACGPEAMLRALADICTTAGIPCQLALERHMACGMGTCQGCAVKVKADTPAGWAFKLACKDGPVFDAEELLW